MLDYHPCFIYLLPWLIAFFLIMIFFVLKEPIPYHECHWLIRLLEIIGALFAIIGALSLPIPAMIGLNVSLFGAGLLMSKFAEIAKMINDKKDTK